jgi:hypothetical protein
MLLAAGDSTAVEDDAPPDDTCVDPDEADQATARDDVGVGETGSERPVRAFDDAAEQPAPSRRVKRTPIAGTVRR